jgi:hypothetical protein
MTHDRAIAAIYIALIVGGTASSFVPMVLHFIR